jgi:hypothetical protein
MHDRRRLRRSKRTVASVTKIREDHMAYMNFSEAGADLQVPAAPPAPAARTGFTALEWSVVALARKDGLATLKEPSRVARAVGSLFGTLRESRLTDERLEALRRIAVLAWRQSHVIPLSEIRAFKAAGFTLDQYEMLQASISRGRAQNGRRSS